jgi:hypothetical protein
MQSVTIVSILEHENLIFNTFIDLSVLIYYVAGTDNGYGLQYLVPPVELEWMDYLGD